jgi:hypothetical protein
MRPIYEIRITFEATVSAFTQALELPSNRRSDFFNDVRATFREKIEESIHAAGMPARPGPSTPPRLTRNAKIRNLSPMMKMTGWNNEIPVEIDSEFAVGCGADVHSLHGLNYHDRAACELPSLRPFLEISDFSLGNFMFHAPNEDCEINVICDNGIELIGVATDVSRRKRASYFGLLGVRLDPQMLANRLKMSERCNHEPELLDEIRIGALFYPVTYICRRCSQLLTCECFDGSYEIKNDLTRLLPYGNTEKDLTTATTRVLSRSGICSLCTGRVPRYLYGHSMYYSTFLQRYLPYHILFSRRRFGRDVYEGEPAYREIENETRQAFGYMRIGQKWLNETFLYKLVSQILEPAEVIHHYRGKELDGLELDIWIPSLRLGIEYQGEQHYKAMAHWGGQLGLERRLSNDQKKKVLCERLGYKLIEFHHSQTVSELNVQTWLNPFLKS